MNQNTQDNAAALRARLKQRRAEIPPQDRDRGALLIRGRLYTWLAMMLANCTEAAYRINKTRMVRLAEYSRDCLGDLRRETGIAYDGRSMGTVQLFVPAPEFHAAARAEHRYIQNPARGFQAGRDAAGEALVEANGGTPPAGAGGVVEDLVEAGELGRGEALPVVLGA